MNNDHPIRHQDLLKLLFDTQTYCPWLVPRSATTLQKRRKFLPGRPISEFQFQFQFPNRQQLALRRMSVFQYCLHRNPESQSQHRICFQSPERTFLLGNLGSHGLLVTMFHSPGPTCHSCNHRISHRHTWTHYTAIQEC